MLVSLSNWRRHGSHVKSVAKKCTHNLTLHDMLIQKLTQLERPLELVDDYESYLWQFKNGDLRFIPIWLLSIFYHYFEDIKSVRKNTLHTLFSYDVFFHNGVDDYVLSCFFGVSEHAYNFVAYDNILEVLQGNQVCQSYGQEFKRCFNPKLAACHIDLYCDRCVDYKLFSSMDGFSYSKEIIIAYQRKIKDDLYNKFERSMNFSKPQIQKEDRHDKNDNVIQPVIEKKKKYTNYELYSDISKIVTDSDESNDSYQGDDDDCQERIDELTLCKKKTFCKNMYTVCFFRK